MDLKDLQGLSKDEDLAKHKFFKRPVSPSGEDKDYYLNQVKAAFYYNCLNAGNGYMTNVRRQEFIQNRLIATGRNSIAPLVKKIKGTYGKKKDGESDVNLVNLDWEGLKLVSKFRDIMIGKIEELEFDFVATAINPEAGAEKEAIKNKIWAETQQAEWIKMMESIAGVQLYQKAETEIPIETKRDLDLYMGIEFKHAYETSIELGIKYVVEDNRWDMLKKLLIEDAFDLGRFCVDPVQNPIDGRVELRYVDIVNAVLPEFRGHFMEYPEMCGYFYTITVAQLMASTPEGQITPEKAMELAQRYSSRFGNPTYQTPQTTIYNTDATFNALLAYNVPVFKLYFEATDRLKSETKQREFDKKVMWVDPSTPIGESEYNETRKSAGKQFKAKKKVEATDVHFYHQVHWIIGSDIVFDYGKVPNQARSLSKSKLAMCPLKYYVVDHISMIDRLRVFDEAANLAWLKMQAAKASARPTGYSIDVSALANLKVDSKDMTLDKAIQIYDQTGNLVWASRNFLQPDNMVGYKPIQTIENGLGKDYQDWLNDLAYNYNMMREVIGLNAATDATTQNDRTLSGVARLSVQGTQNALSQLVYALTFLSSRMAEEIAQKLQILVKYGDITVLEQSIGSASVRLIGSEITPHTFGFMLQARPTIEQRAELKEAAKSALINTSDPIKGGLNYDDYFYICNLIDSPVNFKLTQLVFGYLVKRNLQRQAAMQQQSIQAQSEGNMQRDDALFQQKVALMDKQLQNDLALLQAEAQIDAQKNSGKAQEKYIINEQKSDLKKNEATHKAIIDSNTTT
jgi:hypothetical protein